MTSEETDPWFEVLFDYNSAFWIFLCFSKNSSNIIAPVEYFFLLIEHDPTAVLFFHFILFHGCPPLILVYMRIIFLVNEFLINVEKSTLE